MMARAFMRPWYDASMDESRTRPIVRLIALFVLGALLLAISLSRVSTVRDSVDASALEPGTRYTYSIDGDSILTEQMALDFTKQAALEDDGRATQTMTPVPYCELKNSAEHTELLFARTLENPNAGYVLWSAGLGKDPWDYLVTIEKQDDKVECTVHRNKSVR
jgi:hypothetical protein